MDSQHEAVHFDKITVRLTKLSYSFNQKHCDPVLITQKVRVGLCKGVTTTQLDELAAETVSAMMTNHPGYGLFTTRFAVSNLHKNTKKLFSETSKEMYNNFNERAGQKAPFISDEVYEIIMAVSFLAYSILLFSAQFYKTYQGSPVYKGILQPDMWDVMPSSPWDWRTFREKIARNGVRYSLLVATMPIASTSQILDNNECFEPYISNIYSKEVLRVFLQLYLYP
ncbi:Ribonucleoside-diphosphate reductase large subunit [Platanthera guangdongensis]|uniref:Ribonucleoside-diphosphate reductase large subunit n=1 Tax=Platanthera guangdongensis TaxID=2320717 RepID=A0ABR2LWU6_9ASPA